MRKACQFLSPLFPQLCFTLSLEAKGRKLNNEKKKKKEVKIGYLLFTKNTKSHPPPLHAFAILAFAILGTCCRRHTMFFLASDTLCLPRKVTAFSCFLLVFLRLRSSWVPAFSTLIDQTSRRLHVFNVPSRFSFSHPYLQPTAFLQKHTLPSIHTYGKQYQATLAHAP